MEQESDLSKKKQQQMRAELIAAGAKTSEEKQQTRDWYHIFENECEILLKINSFA